MQSGQEMSEASETISGVGARDAEMRVKVSKAATRDAASDAAEGWPYGMLKSGEIGWRLRTGSSPTQRLLI